MLRYSVSARASFLARVRARGYDRATAPRSCLGSRGADADRRHADSVGRFVWKRYGIPDLEKLIRVVERPNGWNSKKCTLDGVLTMHRPVGALRISPLLRRDLVIIGLPRQHLQLIEVGGLIAGLLELPDIRASFEKNTRSCPEGSRPPRRG